MNCALVTWGAFPADTPLALPAGGNTALLWGKCSPEGKAQSAAAAALLQTLLKARFGIADGALCHDMNGKPLLAGAKAPALSVSLSHSGGYAAAAAGEAPYLGVDVQRLLPWAQADRLEIAFTPRERRCLTAAGGTSEQITALWSAKEAVCKALGIGFLRGFHYAEVLTDFRGEAELFFRDAGVFPMEAPVLLLGRAENAVCAVFSAASGGENTRLSE